MLYIDKLLDCKEKFWFFDKDSAYKKYQELKKEGLRVDIVKEKVYNYTVFVM